jgi:hypothetical protein
MRVYAYLLMGSTNWTRLEEEGGCTGALCAFEPPEGGGSGLLVSLAEGAVFPPVILGLGRLASVFSALAEQPHHTRHGGSLPPGCSRQQPR